MATKKRLQRQRWRKFWIAPIRRKLNRYNFTYRSIFPYLSGDTFRALGEVIVDDTNKTPVDGFIEKEKVIVFCQQTKAGHYLDQFFETVQHKLDRPFVLVSHNGMTPDWSKYESELDNPNMLAWYGKNLEYTHHKAHTLPLGVVNPRDPHMRGRSATFWNALRRSKAEKDIDCYFNVGIGYPKQKRYEGRIKALDYFHQQSFSTFAGERTWNKYAHEMHRSKFVVAPIGEALDSFRLWESLYLGAIPIVTSNPLDRLYRKFPVWIVEDWEEVTTDSMKMKYAELTPQFANLPQLWAGHWYREIVKHVS